MKNLRSVFVTTFAGLAVAIPSLLASHYLEGRIVWLFHQIDELAFHLLPQLERYEGRMRFGQPGKNGDEPTDEPPARVVLAWQLDERWQYDPDPAHASEVEVRFIVEGPSQTRIELEHRGFERHGAGADAVRGGIDAPTGWTYVLDLFAKHVAA